MDRPRLWSQSAARRSLLGESTMNPTIAAKSLLGAKKVAAGTRALKKYRKKSLHRGNPTLASLGSILPIPGGGLIGGLLGGLGGRFKKPSEVRAAAVAPGIIQAANAGNLTAARGLLERAAIPMLPKESAVWKAAAAQLAPNIVSEVQKRLKTIPQANQANPEAFAQSVTASPVQLPGTAPTSPGLLATPGGAQAAAGVIRALTSRGRGRRGYGGGYGRYPTYTDRYGRQRYSTQPPGTELRIPQGATMTPGTPYNFFRGAVGSGGALATAGQVALAAGAGIGAYLVTQKLLERLGGGAQSKEEAGVQAGMALHDAIVEFQKQKGRVPTPAERAEMKSAYQAKLVELGYDPVTFTRQRSGIEGFLETYNPLGG